MDIIKISILVPIYRAEKYIERCAKSLFEQTYPNIEFVFVNDCTPDKSIELLKSVLGQYPKRINQVKIIEHEKNCGVAASRNTLLDNATGEYLLWVDADDYITKNAVEILVNNATTTNTDITCFGAALYTGSNIKPLQQINEETPETFIDHLLSGQTPTALWGRMIKRSLFINNNINFIQGLDVGEDLLVLIKVAFYTKTITNVNQTLYFYDNTNTMSLCRSYSMQKLNMRLKVLDELNNFLKGKIDCEKYIRERKLDILLSQIYGTCLENSEQSYLLIRTELKNIDWRNTTIRKNKLYKFFLICDNYKINRKWAQFMLFLKSTYLFISKSSSKMRLYQRNSNSHTIFS